MKEFTTQQIQERFEKLPKELQEAVNSPDVGDKIREVGKRHELMIDQVGELVDEIGLIMLGFERSSNFVKQTSSKLGITTEKARQIGEDINKEVFSSVRDQIRKLEAEEFDKASSENFGVRSEQSNPAETSISSIEKVGGFTLEKETSPSTTVYLRDKSDILSGIENPPPSQEVMVKKGGMPDNHTEPLVDHLLSKPVSQVDEKISVGPIKNKPNSNAVANSSANNTSTRPVGGPDPYREAVSEAKKPQNKI